MSKWLVLGMVLLVVVLGIFIFNIQNFTIEYLKPDYDLPEDFIDHMSAFNLTDNQFAAGDRIQVFSSIDKNYSRCDSFDFYKNSLKDYDDAESLLLINLKLYFLAEQCNMDSTEYRKEIVGLSSIISENWFLNLFENRKVEEVEIKRKVEIPQNPTKLILGRSKIIVSSDDIVGHQTERVSRDWISYYIFGFPTQTTDELKIWHYPNYMEGHLIQRILEYSEATPEALSFILAKNFGMFYPKYYAPDENGIPRFMVLNDKLQYPTAECFKDICFSYETHGISSLVPQAIIKNASLVVGCGDSIGKMKAAFYLADRGVNVYFPTDRFVGEILFYDAPGILIGSAPVRKMGNTAVIGDQIIEINLSEKIIVQNTRIEVYPTQYYDSASRYFKSLEKFSGIDLNLITVHVVDKDEADKLIKRAEKENANVIALKIYSEKEYEEIKEWLLKDKNNRIVLFHSVVYEHGRKLFYEFPDQITFGDPRPVFE